MRHFPSPACVTALALMGLTACGDNRTVRLSRSDDEGAKGVLKVIETLQCPETQGSLTRKGSAQAEGTICTYNGPKGSEVTVHLVSLENDTATEVLTTFETMLKRALPLAAAQMTQPTPPEPPASPGEATPAPGTADIDVPGMTIRSDGDDASVNLPGLSVETSGETASVRIGGFQIDADETSNDVSISSSDDSVSVQAHDDAAEIRTRAPGDALRTTYILTDTNPSAEGWRLVGYEARGPAGGPIVVATVRAKDRDQDAVFEDAKDLVTLNIGE